MELWIDRILDECRTVTPEEIAAFSAKLGPCEDGETPTGQVIPEELQKLMVVTDRYMEASNARITEHQKLHDDPDHNGENCKAFRESERPKKAAAELLRDLFWVEANEIIGTTNSNLSIRQGFVLMKSEPDPFADLGSLLGGMPAGIEVLSL